MPVVTFRTLGKSATVPAGTSLLDAAAQAGVTITAPCGGEGVCGECRVRIDSSAHPVGTGACELVEHVPRGCLSPDELAEGWVLACSSRVIVDITVHATEQVAFISASLALTDRASSFNGENLLFEART